MEQNIQDVEHIKLKTDRLFHRITRNDTALSQASMMENFLRTANEGQIKYVGDHNQKLMTYS
jgi:hypothetical protein